MIYPLTADSLIINEDTVTLNSFEPKTANNHFTSEIQPAIVTKEREFYAARGIVKQQDGSIYLTAYPTNSTQRNSDTIPLNCGYN